MAKSKGKDLEFWWNAQEEPVENIKATEAFGTEEGTDTSTPGDGKDFEVIRADRSFSGEQILYTPDGTEVVTGTLVAGTRYRVTGGTITETQGTFTLGMIFESDGTGTASGTNKVKPLGTRVSGKDMAITLDSVEVPVTDIEYSSNYDELDGTDTSTTGDATETETNRADRESKITMIMRSESADLLTTSPGVKTIVITLASGQTISGSGILTQKETDAQVKDYVKKTYTIKWRGKPTETLVGLATAVENAFKVIYKRGASTNKETTGNAIITQKTITANIKSLIKVSYTFRVNGAPSYAVAN